MAVLKSFNLGNGLKEYSKRINRGIGKFRNELEENAKAACETALSVIRDVTPHAGDGRPRGKNVITDALQNSWNIDYRIVNRNSRERIYAKVSVSNDRYYAPFVQYGHKMSVHFVPWLYIDGSNLISRSMNQSGPVFGLVVGRKTPFVEGIDMIGPAIDAFNETFDRLNEKSFENSFRK